MAPPLCTGIMWDPFQADGTTIASDYIVNGSAISQATSFKNLEDKSYGPVGFLTSRNDR